MIRRTIDAGEEVPRGYGLAWWKYETRQAICYPFPLNHVLGWLRDRLISIRHRKGKNYVTMLEASAIASKAYQDGYAHGKSSMMPPRPRFDWPVKES